MAYNILLVDDEQAFREEIKECLEEYEVFEAGDGEAALKILKEPNEIDLIVLDYMMPGMKGTEVLSRIKRDNPNLPVIMLTGYGSKEVVIKALREDAEDFLEKPVNVEKLKNTIDNIFSKKQIEQNKEKGEIDNEVARVKLFIERNCYKKVSLEGAARAVSLSSKYLSRLFKKEAGIGFKEYVQQVKVASAKELLLKTGMTVSEISYKLGYENPETFIRLFKRVTGGNPSAFRKKGKPLKVPAKNRKR